MIYGNVVNDGLIDNLPAGACVEVPCVVDRTGVQPTRVGALPAQCAALNRTFLNVVELTVRAALEGSREHVYHAAMLDPNASASLDLDDDPRRLRRADRRPRGRAAGPGVSELDLLVVGDVNADLVLRGGDLVPAFGQREQLVDDGVAGARRLGRDRGGRRGAARAARWRWPAASATTSLGRAMLEALARCRRRARCGSVDGADRDQRRPWRGRATARC